jgi:hypothetical protein
MPHDTILLAHARHGLPSHPCESLDQGHGPGEPSVDVDGQCFRVRTSRFATQWLPDTPSNRHTTVVVVEGVLQELLQTPLAGPTELAPRVNAQLGRDDLTVANMESALEQISCVPVLRTLRRQLEAGTIQYQEAYLLSELLEGLSAPVGLSAGGGVARVEQGMQRADPTALTALVTPDLPLQQVDGSLCWLTFLMTLCYWHVPVSVLGRWCGVHQTTI